MKYQTLNTVNDTLKERYILGCELSGKYGFPKLPSVNAGLHEIRAVPFSGAKSEKRPKECICHFFIDDMHFERVWNNPEKYLDILANFKYVCAPDFSMYSDMPLVLQIYQVYRSRALAWYLYLHGIDIIPTVAWAFEDSYDFCFDGLPEQSTLAVSTNGCFLKEGTECYQNGFSEMCHRLRPKKILIVGREIPVETDAEIVYMESFGQTMGRRLKPKDGIKKRK